jgi:hypothetical protein
MEIHEGEKPKSRIFVVLGDRQQPASTLRGTCARCAGACYPGLVHARGSSAPALVL